MEKVDALIKARWTITVEPDCAVREHWAVAVRNGRIAAVGPADDLAPRVDAGTVVDRPGHLLIPGLVNAHTHAAMTLLRGLANDVPLMTWLHQHVWPAEKRWMSAEFVEHGTDLAVAEMLLGGTTTFNDMYFFPEVAARVAARRGMRAVIGMIVVQFPNPWADDEQTCIRQGLRMRDEYKGHPLVSTAFAPHAPYSVSDESLNKIRRLADELDVPVHMHVHETQDEITESLKAHGCRPLERLDRLGLVSPLLGAVHMTQLAEGEAEQIADAGVSVLHCPESNLKLASGFCPVAQLVELGVNVAIGTDGAASNNDLDMLGEMRTAALLAKGVASDPSALGAEAALTAATLGGARALGLAGDIGSITPGKWADLCCIDFRHPATQPVYDALAQLVYASGRDQVSDVWVAGREVVREGRLTTLEAGPAIADAQAWQQRIARADREEAR
jgi:5-methylthioadenosine/S-adenosylhomocysteine deaminase